MEGKRSNVDFLVKNKIFEKSKKIEKIKIFKNFMHSWNQHDKLHYQCNLHQNRTNLVQFRKNTLKVKKNEKIEKKSKK